jgi:hypothetical protein
MIHTRRFESGFDLTEERVRGKTDMQWADWQTPELALFTSADTSAGTVHVTCQ